MGGVVWLSLAGISIWLYIKYPEVANFGRPRCLLCNKHITVFDALAGNTKSLATFPVHSGCARDLVKKELAKEFGK